MMAYTFICISLTAITWETLFVIELLFSSFTKALETLNSAVTIDITGWANPAVELESTPWITVTCWSHQPFTGVWGQRTRLCTAIIQKTAAVVVKNVGTSCTTDGSRHADELVTKLWKWIRNGTDTRVQQIFFYVLVVFKRICYKPKATDVNANYSNLS